MLSSKKPLIFSIAKVSRNSSQVLAEKSLSDDSRDNRARAAWSKQEDEAVIDLVRTLGSKNWTLLAKQLKEVYNMHDRSSKQCRERWHNHLDPSIKKDYWSDEEEAILFTKHIEFGNKWSEIAKFLPGRTDNTIKNHFYSKLRKFIRKIVKMLIKERIFVDNNIDPAVYTPERIYKIMKNQQVPYDALSKESIVDMILKHDINNKNAYNNNKEYFEKSGVGSNTEKKKCGNFYQIKQEEIKPDEELLIKQQMKLVNQQLQQQNAIFTHYNMINNINTLNQLVNNMNFPSGEPVNGNQSSLINNYSASNNPNLTINLIQNMNNINNLNQLSSMSGNMHKNLNNNNSNYNNFGNNNIGQNLGNNFNNTYNNYSVNNSDKLNASINYLSQTKNMMNYLNDSQIPDVKTMNMSRMHPQMNQNSHFTLGNDTLSTILNNNDKKILTMGQGEIDENQYTDMLLNNLLNNPALASSKPYLNGNEFNFDKSQTNDLNKNISFSIENDFFFNIDNHSNNTHSKLNTSKSFYKVKSFNCIDPDMINDDHNSSNIFQSINNSALLSGNMLNNSFPFGNINSNTSSAFEMSQIEKFKNFCELQESINNSKQANSACPSVIKPPQLAQLAQPAQQGFSVSPKSAFSKNFNQFSKFNNNYN